MNKLKEIKQSIIALKDKEVIVILKEQRGKTEKHKGILHKTFPHFFNIRTNGMYELEYSFKYLDILTGEISVQSTENPELVIHNEKEKRVFELDLEDLAGTDLADDLLSLEDEDEDDIDFEEMEPPADLTEIDLTADVLEFPYDEDADSLLEETETEIPLDEIDD